MLAVFLWLVTFGVGYVVWAAFAYRRGQTPAKQLLRMYVVDERTGNVATWGTMFVRGFAIDVVIGYFTMGVFSLVSAVWIFRGGDHQRLTDKMVSTVVVDEHRGLSV